MRYIDLHTHAKLSKAFPVEIAAVDRMIAQARRVGLDGIALVEHFHTPDFWVLHEALGRRFAYGDGVYKTEGGFAILTGAELSLLDNGRAADLVLLGTLEQLRRFNRGLASPATGGYRPPLSEAVAAARESGIFVIGAHPFRAGKELRVFGRALAVLDAIEANGTDYRHDGLVYAAARRYALPVVGGSDAHCWPQVGIKATMLLVNEITLHKVTFAIREGLGAVSRLDYGPLAVQISAMYKRLLKARAANPRRAEAPPDWRGGRTAHMG